MVWRCVTGNRLFVTQRTGVFTIAVITFAQLGQRDDVAYPHMIYGVRVDVCTPFVQLLPKHLESHFRCCVFPRAMPFRCDERKE